MTNISPLSIILKSIQNAFNILLQRSYKIIFSIIKGKPVIFSSFFFNFLLMQLRSLIYKFILSKLKFEF